MLALLVGAVVGAALLLAAAGQEQQQQATAAGELLQAGVPEAVAAALALLPEAAVKIQPVLRAVAGWGLQAVTRLLEQSSAGAEVVRFAEAALLPAVAGGAQQSAGAAQVHSAEGVGQL